MTSPKTFSYKLNKKFKRQKEEQNEKRGFFCNNQLVKYSGLDSFEKYLTRQVYFFFLARVMPLERVRIFTSKLFSEANIHTVTQH